MSETARTREFIENYFAALNEDRVGDIPITADCSYYGSMLSEPIFGEAAIKDHLEQIVPFVDRFDVKRTIVEGGNGAVVVRLLGFGKRWVEGAVFFEVTYGKLTSLNNLFDTRQLIDSTEA